METDILTVKEVSEYLKLTEKTAYRLAAEGKIPGFKADINKWIEEQKAVKSKEAGKG